MKAPSFKVVVTTAVLSLTTGCSSLSLRIEPDPLLPSLSKEIDVSGIVGTGTAVCSKENTVLNGKIPSELTHFSVATYCAYKETRPETYWMDRFVTKGLGLSDDNCERFFNELELRRVEASYAQTNTNIAGTALTAVLAATDAHRRAIFNLATLLTAGNAWFENYKANYIMTPQLRKLHELVQGSLRDPIAAAILAKSQANGYRTFDEAKRDLLRYDALCSHKVVYDIVTQSVAKAEIKTFETPPDRSKVEKAIEVKKAIYQAAAGGATGVAAGAFADGEFEGLYVLATTPAGDRVKAAKALVSLFPQIAPYVTKLGLDVATPAPPTLEKFQLAGEYLGLDATEKVRSLRAQIKAKVAEDDKAAAAAAAAPPGTQAFPSTAMINEALARQAKFIETLRAKEAVGSPRINFRYEVLDHR